MNNLEFKCQLALKNIYQQNYLKWICDKCPTARRAWF